MVLLQIRSSRRRCHRSSQIVEEDALGILSLSEYEHQSESEYHEGTLASPKRTTTMHVFIASRCEAWGKRLGGRSSLSEDR